MNAYGSRAHNAGTDAAGPGDGIFRPFSKDVTDRYPLPGAFTNPFRYVPHPLVILAAQAVMQDVSSICIGRQVHRVLSGNSTEAVAHGFSEGKMLGVLVAADSFGHIGYLAGFSGNVGGYSHIDGFVPPVYDLLDPSGPFKKAEEEISAVNRKIKELEDSEDLAGLRKELSCMKAQMEDELCRARASERLAKLGRDAVRSETSDSSRLDELIRQSQFGKAEIRRLKAFWAEKTAAAERRLSERLGEISQLRLRRAEMSDSLQKWIFSQYIVHNAEGQEATVSEIFGSRGLVPPGGTGECAAPKLLEYAYRNGLRPLAMGEFWYGASPATAVRTHGHFYPSCTSKCGPLLGFMLRGLPDTGFHDVIWHSDAKEPQRQCCSHAGSSCGTGTPEVIYEDGSVIVVSKPSGMPSVPGLDGKLSLQEWLEAEGIGKGRHEGQEDSGRLRRSVYAVHRLDMDTSGIMVYAKTPEAASCLMGQFSGHDVKKTYMARLSVPDRFTTGKRLETGGKGRIDIPLSPDYDERPRQKADTAHGKESVTEYEVERIRHDGKADIIFRPLTGRTHQLRVHSAHTLGLARPIEGDLLYGGCSVFNIAYAGRLCLHALGISFFHPEDGREMSFTSYLNSYSSPEY